MRVFPDTNVLVSAFIAHGLSAEIFRLIIKEHTLVLGDIVLNELERVLLEKFSIPTSQVADILNYLDTFEQIHFSGEASPLELRDKDDEKVLILAIKSKCDVFVTGDNDLLDVRDQIPYKILSPRELFQLFKSPK